MPFLQVLKNFVLARECTGVSTFCSLNLLFDIKFAWTYCKECLQMTIKVSSCVLTEHQEQTYVSVGLCFVFWGVVLLHTPAYFATYHLLFGSWGSWWVAFSAWVHLMWKRPVDQEETCGRERQMPGLTVLCTKSETLCYILYVNTTFNQEAKLLRKWLIYLCQVQCTLLLGDTHGYGSLDRSHSQDVKYWRFVTLLGFSYRLFAPHTYASHTL